MSAEALERAALGYLERYEASAAALRRVLRNRVKRALLLGAELDVDAAHHDIELILFRCKAGGLVDDARYAEAKLRSLRRAGGSEHAIRSRLRAQGVAQGVIDEVLGQEPERSGAGAEESELEAARTFVRRRRLGPHRPAGEREARRQRDLAALARAGFSYEVALKALGAADE